MTYLTWNTKKTTPESGEVTTEKIDDLYDQGYVATRIEKGMFNQTRSARIRLAYFELSSENRRVLRKMDEVNGSGITLEAHPLPYAEYHWSIHKFAKDFYTAKFGDNIFSANKIREILSEKDKSDFNTLLVFRDISTRTVVGYCIALKTDTILHYSYPFYDLAFAEKNNPSLGLGMMTMAIEFAKDSGLTFVYLGSLQRPTDIYKAQFSGFEWFDGKEWKKDIAGLKEILK